MPSPPQASPRRRTAKAAATLGKLAALALVFVLALIASTLIHLNSHAGRTAITHVVNRALRPVFEGSLVVESIEDLSLDSVHLSRVLVVDPNAERVLQLRNVRVQLNPSDLFVSYWDHEPNALTTYNFPHLRAEEADVLLLRDAEQGVTLARALTPKPSSTPTAKGKAPSNIRLWFPTIELGRVQGSFDLPVLERLLPRLVAVRGSLMVSPNGVAVDVDRFGMVVAGLPAKLYGTGTVKVRVPGSIEVQFSGYLNDSEAQASFELRDDTLDVTLRSPQVTAETVRAFLPGWPLTSAVTLQAHANGALPFLNVDLLASTPHPVESFTVPLQEQTASFASEAQLDLSDGLELTMVSRVSQLSLALLGPSWPASNINALLSTQLRSHDDTFTHHTDGYIPATTIYDQELPELSFAVTTEGGRTELELDVDEPGAPGTVVAQYLHTGEFDAQVSIPQLTLHNQRRLPHDVTGLASIQGTAQVRGSRLALNADVAVANLKTPVFALGRATLQARTEQTLEAPTANPATFNVAGSNLDISGVKWERVNADGTVTTSALDAAIKLVDAQTGSIDARAQYTFATGTIRNLNAVIDRSGLRATMRVPLLDVTVPRVELAHLEIVRPNCTAAEQCPHVVAQGVYQPGQMRAKVDAQSVQLERLWPLFGQHLGVYGMVNLALDLNSEPDVRSKLELHATDVSFLGYGRGTLDAQATLLNSRLSGNISATNSLGVQVAADTNLTLHQSPLELETWKQVTGTASVRGAIDQLETIEPLLQQRWLESLSGNAEFLATLNRLNPRDRPAVAAELRVRDLEVSARPDRDAPAVTIKQHGLYVNATFDADTSVLYGSALLHDVTGPLLRVKNATIPLPLLSSTDVVNRPSLLVNASLETRDAQQLPYLNRTPLTGSLGAELTLYGTLEQPETKLLVVGSRLSMPGLDPTLPVDLSGNVHYRLADDSIEVDVAAATDRKTVLLATLDGKLDPQVAYTGSARVLLDDLPLSLISAVSDVDVGGHVTGLFELTPSPAPHASLALNFTDLSSGRAVVGDGRLRGDLAPGRFSAQFSVTNIEHSILLSLDALSAPAHLPSLTTVNHVRALVKTRKMNTATLSPLLKGVVARLGGNLDSDVSLEWQKETTDEGDTWSNKVSGVAHLRNGLAYVDALGLELQDITADAVATPLGERTHLALDRVQAKARSREVNVEGRGQLVFDGMRVASGSANVLLRDVPLTLQGLNLGKASGTASAELQRMTDWPNAPHRGKPYVLVNATLADFSLRAARTASRSLIDTGSNSEFDIVQNKSNVQQEDILPYRVYVDLGRDARFSLEDLDIPLSGVTQIDYTNESILSGTIVLKSGGRIPLLGRLFEVREGNLRLNPAEPSNPDIDISLTGRSKDGDPLDVTLTGTLQEPIVTPTLARLQELLGGGAASALSGGFQALGLASMLGDAVQLRVGTDAADESLARYSAAVEVREDLWFEVNYQRSDTAAFQTKNEGALSGTLDYRLNDNWSLRTEAGTAGGSVDVVWQFRY